MARFPAPGVISLLLSGPKSAWTAVGCIQHVRITCCTIISCHAGSYVVHRCCNWAEPLNCFTPEAACTVFSRNIKARLKESSFRVISSSWVPSVHSLHQLVFIFNPWEATKGHVNNLYCFGNCKRRCLVPATRVSISLWLLWGILPTQVT